MVSRRIHKKKLSGLSHSWLVQHKAAARQDSYSSPSRWNCGISPCFSFPKFWRLLSMETFAQWKAQGSNRTPWPTKVKNNSLPVKPKKDDVERDMRGSSNSETVCCRRVRKSQFVDENGGKGFKEANPGLFITNFLWRWRQLSNL